MCVYNESQCHAQILCLEHVRVQRHYVSTAVFLKYHYATDFLVRMLSSKYTAQMVAVLYYDHLLLLMLFIS